jgi:hypothetical protein
MAGKPNDKQAAWQDVLPDCWHESMAASLTAGKQSRLHDCRLAIRQVCVSSVRQGSQPASKRAILTAGKQASKQNKNDGCPHSQPSGRPVFESSA